MKHYELMQGNSPKISIQGRYLGGITSSKGHLKWLRIETERGEQQIKLSKYIGCTLSQEIQPGAEIRVWARPKKDYLKALMVVPLNPKLKIEPLPELSRQFKPLTIQVCQKGGCRKRGGAKVWAALQQEIEARKAGSTICLEATGCQKNCKQGPNICLGPKSVRYSRVQTSQVPVILEKHLLTQR